MHNEYIYQYPDQIILFDNNIHETDNTFFISLISVIVGFVLAIAWDLWKRNSEKIAELKRACRSIIQEAEENFNTIDSCITLLNQDNATTNGNPA